MAYRFQSLYFDNPIVPERVLDILQPEVCTRELALFFIHGGGWSGGSRQNLHLIMRGFNAEGYICGSTDYRMRGATIEDQIEDVTEGYRHFLGELEALERPLRVVVFGSSAGAHLTFMLGMRGAPEADLPLPAALIGQATPVLFQPWEEILPSIWASMQRIVGEPYEPDSDAYARVAPINYISEQTPPVLLLEAGYEGMFPREFNEAFIEQVRELGRPAEMIDYPKAEHGFFYALSRPCQKQAFADISAYLERLEQAGG